MSIPHPSNTAKSDIGLQVMCDRALLYRSKSRPNASDLPSVPITMSHDITS